MIDLARAITGLWGAWKLVQFDKRGLTGFDAKPEGFAHSFWALGLALPVFVVAMGLQNTVSVANNGTSFPLLLSLLDYLARWAGFLIFAYGFSRLLDLQHNFIGFATVYNWLKPLLIAIPLPILAFSALGLIGGEALDLFSIGMIFYLSAVQIYILHVALGATWGESIGIFIAVYAFDFIVRLSLAKLF